MPLGRNSQIVVDDTYKFIVATDVTSDGSDKKQLHCMAKQTQEVLNNDTMTLTADKGYYSAVEIKKCVDDNISTVVPLIRTGQEQTNKGKFMKEKFIYDKELDAYICPNSKLISRTNSNNKSYARIMHIYRSSQSDCLSWAIKDECLGKKTKQKQTQKSINLYKTSKY